MRLNDTEGGGSSPFRPRRDDPILLAVVAVLAILGFAWAAQNYDREHEPHVVVARVREIEAQIRSQGPAPWLLVEGRHVADGRDPAQEDRHQATLRDLERLASLKGLAFVGLKVEVRGGEAVARFRVTGKSTDDRLPPVRGELVFARRHAGWLLVGSRLFER